MDVQAHGILCIVPSERNAGEHQNQCTKLCSVYKLQQFYIKINFNSNL